MRFQILSGFDRGLSKQCEIDFIDRKIDLHRRKRAVLDELFILRHKPMTGKICVGDLDLSIIGNSRSLLYQQE